MLQPRLPLRFLLIIAFCFGGFASPARTQTTGAGQWTWMGGSSTVSGQFGNWPGIYGTKGVPAPANIPPTRVDVVTWTDSEGHFWLFGGSNFPSALNYFNDLWEFDPGTNEWTWMAGDNTIGNNCPVISTIANCGQPGVYGTLGEPAPANSPGGRENAQSWIDKNDNLWLYGGLGFDGAGNFVSLNDLWKFDISIAEWTWVAGNATIPLLPNCPSCISGIPPVPGTEGTPAAANTPGSLWLGTNWTDDKGNFWLFAGWGETPGGNGAVANDLWEFDPSAGEWTWIGGSPNFGIDGRVSGIYGTLGIPAPENFPGTRWQDATWVDTSGNLWLFGGEGADATSIYEGILNDLWKYDPASREWTWMGGSSTFSCANYPQQYCHVSGVYGTLGQPSPGNIPGSRLVASSWRDKSGNFWMFGGEGFDSDSNWGYLNDLWEFNLTANEWTWMSGTSILSVSSIAGIYGIMGVPSAANVPGVRAGAASWTDKYGDLWLWGGDGYDSAGTYGSENDLWRYQPASAVPPVTTATPVFSPTSGTYLTAQSITITDSTAGAMIYYSTDGTTPTTGSTQYTGPIVVIATETIQAIATAPNDLQSAVASATYTIPADFTLAINPASVVVQSGSSASLTITVKDEGGFNSVPTFACSGLPRGAACKFTLEVVPTNPYTTYMALTVTTSAAGATLRKNRSPMIPGSAFAAALCLLGWKKRRWMQALLLVVCMVTLSASTGCADVNLANASSTSTVTVTASSGALSHSTSFTLRVN